MWLTLTDADGVILERWYLPETTASKVRDRIEGTLDVYEDKEEYEAIMSE